MIEQSSGARLEYKRKAAEVMDVFDSLEDRFDLLARLEGSDWRLVAISDGIELRRPWGDFVVQMIVGSGITIRRWVRSHGEWVSRKDALESYIGVFPNYQPSVAIFDGLEEFGGKSVMDLAGAYLLLDELLKILTIAEV